MKRPPFFIIASPRSGSSMFRLMLTSHEQLHVPPECGFALWLAPRYGSWNARGMDDQLEAFIADLFASKKFETWSLSRPALSDWIRGEARPADYAGLVSAVYEFHARQRGAGIERWGDKNNYYLHHVGELDALFPDAQFIHLVRDARDVACSYVELSRRTLTSPYAPRLPDRVDAAASEWQANVDEIRAATSGMDPERVIEVRFEDAVRDPEQTLTRVCTFLGVAFRPAMLDFHERNRREQLEPAATMEWKERTLQPVDFSRTGRYLSDLSDEERRTVERIARRGLSQYGYLDADGSR